MASVVPEELIAELKRSRSLPEIFSSIVQRSPDAVVYSQAQIASDSSRSWHSATYRDVGGKIWRLAQFLIRSGVRPGDKVAIISFTRPEWLIADLAILYAGATSVAIYQSINAQETGYILFDSGAKFIFAENEEQVRKLDELERQGCPIPATEDRPAQTASFRFGKVVTFEQVESRPTAVWLQSVLQDSAIPATEPKLTALTETASLVYTSGTTGPPKGVIQTHANHLANLWQACKTGLFAPDGDIFVFLPLAHSFARLIGYIGFFTPTILKFPAVADRRSSVLNVPSILHDLKDAGSQVVPIVPRILEKLMNGIQEKLRGQGIGAKILAAAVLSSKAVFESRTKGIPAPLHLRLVYPLLAPIRHKVKKQLFGNGFRHIVSGGAKLPVPVNEFFASLGITIYEGYGLTETCVATNVNRVEKNKIGSVGPCLEGVEIKIADDGEILFRGPNIAVGYLNRPQATRAQWDSDGWFHTGDLGELDADRYLSITGRKKELIVTSGGKKISPLMIEDKLAASPFIASAVVVGDGKQYCSALIVPDTVIVKQWSARKGITLQSALSASPEVVDRLQREIDHVNDSLSKFETIKKFRIIDRELTVENGFLTPTFKIKRGLVERTFKHLIDEMYSS